MSMAPDAPDYAAANREGILTDIETLPLRRQIEQAAALGKGGVAGGKYYEDLAAVTRRKDILEQLMEAEKSKDIMERSPSYYQALAKEWNELSKFQSFEGLGDDALTRSYMKILLDSNDEAQRRQLALRQDIGVANVEQTLKELEASDPEGFAARKKLTQLLSDEAGKPVEVDPNLARALEDAAAEYGLGSKLDDVSRSEVEQQARAAQAARGNILGNASAFAEAMEVGAAGEARKQARLGNLVNLATQVDNTKYGREQQALSSLSSFSMGNPISNQFGNLGGAQQGAVGFTNFGVQQGTTLNPNAGQQGASFALNNYQNVLAASQNPWTNIVSGVAGKVAGAYTGGLMGG